MPDRLSHLNALLAARCLIAILLTDFVHSTLVVVPSDTVAINGSNTRLYCSTDLSTPVHWQHIPHGSMLPTDVYLQNIIVNRYVGGRFHVEVDIRKGAYNLAINNVQFEDAGVFRCLDNRGEGDQKDAKLSVTENTELQLEPRFPEVQVGEKFQFTCKTYYKDKAIRWQRIAMGSMLPDDVYLEDQLVNGHETRYEVKKEVEAGINKLIIKKAELRDSGTFRCIDKEGHGQQVDSQLTVVGTPECHSSVNASCTLENMETITLTCGVNFSGKTPPTIVWKHEGRTIGDSNSVFADKVESYLTIHIEQGRSYSSPYSCLSTASNSSCIIIIQHSCTTVSDESTVTPKAGPVKSDDEIIRIVVPIVVVIVLILIGILIGIIIVFVIKRRRKGRNKGLKTSKDADTEQYFLQRRSREGQ